MSRINIDRLTKKLNENKTTKVPITREDVEILAVCIDRACERDREERSITMQYGDSASKERQFFLEEYPLDSRFVPLCIPCEVVMDSTRLASNIKKINEDGCGFYGKREFIDAQDRILASYRTSLTGDANLESATEVSSFDAEAGKLANVENCHYNATPFRPIVSDVAELMWKEAHFNYEIDDMMDDLFEAIIRNLRNDRK